MLSNKVLILESEKPAAYVLLKDLRKNGYLPISASHIKFNTSSKSKYSCGFLLSPNITEGYVEYKLWLLNELMSSKYLTVMSFSDKTTKLLSDNKTLFQNYTYIYQPSPTIIENVFDKKKTYQLAKLCGIKVPKIFKIGNNFDDILNTMDFPVVLKPTKKVFWLNGKSKIFKINHDNYVWNKNQFINKYKKLANDINEFEVQEYIEGVGRGYFTVIYDGKYIGNFAHERLREYPVTGGASSLRKSIDYNKISDVSKPLINKLNWNGPIMVEYKYDKISDNYYLMEINGRWWGSLPLSIYCGINFPTMMLDALTKKRKSYPITYKIGYQSRLLFPHDILWLFIHIFKGKIFKVYSFFNNAAKEDIWDKTDKIPFFINIYLSFRELNVIIYKRLVKFIN